MVSTLLKKYSSVGMFIPNNMENKCSKPPASTYIYILYLHILYVYIYIYILYMYIYIYILCIYIYVYIYILYECSHEFISNDVPMSFPCQVPTDIAIAPWPTSGTTGSACGVRFAPKTRTAEDWHWRRLRSALEAPTITHVDPWCCYINPYRLWLIYG